MSTKRAHITSTLSLFTSFSTLFCCALPVLLVALGAGAALASITSAIPQLIWVSKHKIEIYIFATCMLSFAGYLQWRARYAPCPADKALAQACARQRRISKIIYGVSLSMYLIGGFFSFIAPRLFA